MIIMNNEEHIMNTWTF